MKHYEKMLVYPAETMNGMQWNVEFPDIKGVGGAGNTPEEAIKDARENLEVHCRFEQTQNLIKGLEDIKERTTDNLLKDYIDICIQTVNTCF